MALLLPLGCVTADLRSPREPAYCTSAHFVDEGRLSRDGSSQEAARSWTLRWDDQIDGVLDKRSRSCVLGLHIEDGEVRGTFRGHVLGQHREDRFSGRLSGGKPGYILVMRQVGDDYECAYQASLSKRREFIGVWHDSKGRSGDFRLRRKAPL